jgi:hypothetical protein
MGKLKSKVRTRTNTKNPYPKRESINAKFAYGIFRRYGDAVRVTYQYDGSCAQNWRLITWDKLPEDIKKFPEIEELNPDKKPEISPIK